MWSSLAQITTRHIKTLLEEKVREDNSLDYKRELPERNDKGKKEFCADISAFANASGGYILYGVNEEESLPKEITGLSCDLDNEILRLRQIADHHIEPRIPGLDFRVIDGFENGVVLVVSIPNSWIGPHRVKDDKAGFLFFVRSGPGKRPMDLQELRSSFLLSEGLSDKIRRFRDTRLGNIISGEIPIPLPPNPKLILHIVPLNSMSMEPMIAIGEIDLSEVGLYPLGRTSSDHRFNLDGILWTNYGQNPITYTQLFRHGQVETVTVDLVRGHSISPNHCENIIVKFCERYLKIMPELGLSVPIIIMGTLIGVKECTLHIKQMGVWPEETHPIDRDIVLLPDVILQEVTENIPKVLRPKFDALWNAGGFDGSRSYDNEGNWHDPDNR